MRSSHCSAGLCRQPSALFSIISVVILVSLVLSLVGCTKASPTKASPIIATSTTGAQLPTATPTQVPPTQVPPTLPPALVETDPLPGVQIALENPITFYFNQPMQRSSVEAAVSGEPALSGNFSWKDDATVTFKPDKPLLPGTSQVINIGTSAQSAKGMALLQPVSLSYATSAYLTLVQSLPAGDSTDVDPTSAVVAAFNQPVVALGADPASLPSGFTLTPAAPGKGEWVNTSTYIYYPAPALAGGEHYSVSINKDLTSTAGAPMESTAGWSFDTVLPRLVSALPSESNYVRLDASVKLNFSYSMDAASVEANFSLETGDGNAVSGQSGWNENFTTFAFTPTALLQRDSSYSIVLGEQAAALGGTPLGTPVRQTWRTVSDLSITRSVPAEGGTWSINDGLALYLTTYVNPDTIADYATFNPSVANMGAWFDEGQMALYFYGTYDPDTDYTLTVSPDLADYWGSQLGQEYTLHFRTEPLRGSVQFPYNSDTTFLTTKDKGILAQVTNLSAIPITVGTLTIDEFVQMTGMNGYEYRQSFIPADAESWTFHPEVPPNQSTTVTIPVAPDGQPRSPGLYFMRLNLPENSGYTDTIILAVSRFQATLKMSPSEAFVWAVDMDTNTPAADLPVTVYEQSGSVMTAGTTDTNGVFQGPLAPYTDTYNSTFVVLGDLGADNFGFALLYWDDGINPYSFNITSVSFPPAVQGYLYTDRPIYRPGDTVHFRIVVRQASNGHYTLPDLSSYHLEINGPAGDALASFDLPLSAFGTAQSDFTLPIDSIPGDYWFRDKDYTFYTGFKVADYRKPEINLQVSFQSTDVISGTALAAQVNARYFYDAPASNLPVHWVLYRQSAYFDIPNYQVGPVDTSWLEAYSYHFPPYGLGEQVTEGDVRTDANGLASITIPAPAKSGRQQYNLEVTLTDETNLPVSARSSIYVNPAAYYIGVHPDAWSYQAKSMAGFSVLVTDWDGKPAGQRNLSAQFQRVIWVRHDPTPDTMGYLTPTYEPEYTPISSTTLTTAADGTGRLEFNPPEAGTYQLDVSGDGTLTQVIIWVGGAGQGVWPSLPNQRLRLVADKDSYSPGDTAQVFVPNPFSSTALGLLTIERGTVMQHQVLNLEPGGSTIPIALSKEEAPNVYLAVTLLGGDDQGNPDFRQGYVTLPVDPSFEYLDVTLTSTPARTGPGEPVLFNLRITDASGSPVEGEFSLSVVDLAVLSLAEPNAEDIYAAFYGPQALNVNTGLSLAASGQRLRYLPGGMGGGGAGESPASVTRENFPDTAYWDAQIVTDANGEAAVSMNLPDSLTTWQVLVRGLTRDTLVGETQLEVITTSRPADPPGDAAFPGGG